MCERGDEEEVNALARLTYPRLRLESIRVRVPRVPATLFCARAPRAEAKWPQPCAQEGAAISPDRVRHGRGTSLGTSLRTSLVVVVVCGRRAKGNDRTRRAFVHDGCPYDVGHKERDARGLLSRMRTVHP